VCLVLPMFAALERAGQRCSPEHVNVSRETSYVERPFTLISGRRSVSDERRSQKKRAESACLVNAIGRSIELF
jgi:hypothetical protein